MNEPDDEVQIRNLQTGHTTKVCQVKRVMALAFSPDGKTLTVSHKAPTKQKIEFPQLTAYRSSNGHQVWAAFTTTHWNEPDSIEERLTVFDVAYAPDKKTLAGIDNLHNVSIRDPKTGRLLLTLKVPLKKLNWKFSEGSGAGPATLNFSADGETLLSRGPRAVLLWNTDDWKDKL